jgi:ABC-2 type transport system ATP-binding protein
MEEAEYCNRLVLMNRGKIIALGTPGELKRDWMKETVLNVECDNFMKAEELLRKEPIFKETAIFGNLLHLVTLDPEAASARTREILAETGISISNLEVVTPSLEDVFVTLTSEDEAQ